MNCDYVQEELSAFLDREESPDNFDTVLSHLYGCDNCQSFFNSGIKLRSLAASERIPYPVDLDESIGKQVNAKRKANPLSYRMKLPVFAASAVVVVLLIVSFALGFIMQEDIYRREINALLKAPPSQVVYGMPAQVVYPVVMHESKGVLR